MKDPKKDIPRIGFGLFPTPCQKLDAVSARYGRRIVVKRDDLCGMGPGGSQVRKLEYLLASAKQRGCDTVFTTGAAQSSHAALTAVCAARLGLRCVLFLKQRGFTESRGNLALDRLFGAEVRFFDTDYYSAIYDAMLVEEERLSAEGHKCFAIPAGGSNPLGALGGVGCAEEIAIQCPHVEHIVCACGSGGTAAGLLLGAKLYLPGVKVTGLSVGTEPMEEVVQSLAEEAGALLEYNMVLEPGDLRTAFCGGEGCPSPHDTPYMEELARLEGVLLDPVCTGRAWAGMLDLLRKGFFNGSGPIVFVHTGGIANLFAGDLPEA